MTRAEKFEEVFSFKIDTSADCGFFDCSDVPDCKGCEFGEKKYKEWWEAEYKEPTTKNNLGVDAISRKAILDELPSVTPQEPFINKPCVSSGVCEHDKQHVLDKIMSDIEQRPYGVANDSVIQGMKYERAANLELLDKYKTESGGKG